MIGQALLITLRDLAIGSGIACILALLAGRRIATLRRRESEKRQRRARIAHELSVAEQQREATFRVIGPLPQVRDWDKDHSSRVHVGRRG